MASLNFGNDSALDKFNEFLRDYKDFKLDADSIKKGTGIAISAWHLTDWVYSEFKGVSNYKDLGEFRLSLYPSCPSLKIMHDIATAAKHKTVSLPKANLKSTRKHMGAFSREFSKDFDISYLEVELDSGYRLDFEDEIDKVKVFWEEFFSKL